MTASNKTKTRIEGNMVLVDFVAWLQSELDDRDWKQADLARATGMNPAHISRVLGGQRAAGADFCVAIANAFRLPESEVLKRAGIMSRGVSEGYPLVVRRAIAEFTALNSEHQTIIITQMRALNAMDESRRKKKRKKEPSEDNDNRIRFILDNWDQFSEEFKSWVMQEVESYLSLGAIGDEPAHDDAKGHGG